MKTYYVTFISTFETETFSQDITAPGIYIRNLPLARVGS